MREVWRYKLASGRVELVWIKEVINEKWREAGWREGERN